MSAEDRKLDEIFFKYMEADGNNFTIRIGKQIIKVKDEDFKVLKRSIDQYAQEKCLEELTAILKDSKLVAHRCCGVHIRTTERVQELRSSLFTKEGKWNTTGN